MSENSGQEKTEPATAKKRQEARKKGQVAQSPEIPSAVILMAMLGVFYFVGASMLANFSQLFIGIYQDMGQLRFSTISGASAFSMGVFKKLLSLLMPVFIPVLIAGFIASVGQVGFQIHGETFTQGFSRMNPVSGMKRFTSLKSLVELVKSVIKIIFIGAIAYLVLKSDLRQFPSLIQQEVGQILVFIARMALKLCFFVCLAMIALAALDFLYQRWQYEEDLKMTKQEVEDERKQTYGDPKVKARIRGIQMEMARRRMMEAVPEADVVITNPTRLAIALGFDAEKMAAPRVLAKGAGFIAERIREVAAASDVPILENKPLAQALYKMVEIGDDIPVEMYRAVAEVLAYVYRLKGMSGMA